MFDASSLRAYVEGSSNLDVNQLRAATRYDGYDPGSPYIDIFWGVVSAWSHEKQKQLLKFVTAAERLPFGGARYITFVIQRVDLGPEGGDEYADLPTSSTCFGTLMLPVYADKDILERKLGLAVELGCEGFGTG
ncbi:hypothetical protein EJ03DRAFT_277710 [Teratosphaeria nubilosa]|uniref:HECT-type E3 ubiquitin transferase n=1 Tax=Teratosphaeria nubilosa TaxID=161662 RepID=A0A6G1L1A5_9PEZI|nr:hypothetical protein EJ03DRAFT_277710 [Teratosphaeria nubilosa]